jgi:uncharacterized protein YcbK (DUF882 family)
MPKRSRNEVLAWVLAALFAAASVRSGPARAEQEHQVTRGQTWSGLARRYGVTPAALAAANRSSAGTALREGAVLRVPSRGEVFVGPGDSLAEIARRHDATIEAVARSNGLRPTAALRVGQSLLLPGAERAEQIAAAEKRWGKPRRPGVVTVMRLYPRETRKLSMLDDNGRVRRAAISALRQLLRPKDGKRRKDPHPRLLKLLAQVSDHFGGRPIHIVSGLRVAGGNTKDSSQHVAGNAVDFRIPGVPLEALRERCARFDRVGVGLYPRSKFVHLDVRNRNARWTDWSLPGQPAQRRQPDEEQEVVAEPEAEVEDAEPSDDGSQELSDEPEAAPP